MHLSCGDGAARAAAKSTVGAARSCHFGYASWASPNAAALARHIDGPCGTVFADQPSRATMPTTAVNNGATIAAINHTSAPKHPVSAPKPRASFTSPAPIAVGASRCTSRYTVVNAAAPSAAAGPRPEPAATRITAANPGRVSLLGNRL